jgi:hypothetical protein
MPGVVGAARREVDMRFVMLTFVGPEHVARWEGWSAEEKRADIAKHEAWFREHGRWVKGGEELGRPRAAKTIRQGVVTDGPFAETKELLGGFIVLETPDEATALAAAQAWPALAWDGNAVELRPVGSSEAEAGAQSAEERA